MCLGLSQVAQPLHGSRRPLPLRTASFFQDTPACTGEWPQGVQLSSQVNLLPCCVTRLPQTREEVVRNTHTQVHSRLLPSSSPLQPAPEHSQRRTRELHSTGLTSNLVNHKRGSRACPVQLPTLHPHSLHLLLACVLEGELGTLPSTEQTGGELSPPLMVWALGLFDKETETQS